MATSPSANSNSIPLLSSSPPKSNPTIPPRTSSTGLNRNSFTAATATATTTATTTATSSSAVTIAAAASPSFSSSSSSSSPRHSANHQGFTPPAPLPDILSPSAGTDVGLSGGPRQRSPTHSLSPRTPSSPISSFIMHHNQQQPSQPPDPRRYEYENLNFTPKRSWTDDKEKVVRAPFDYVASHPGKDFRFQLINSFNTILQVPPHRLEIITKAVGMLHESSLLVDDVQDSSELRRGFPVAHNIFGVPQTINSANYIYFIALQELQKLNNPAVISVFASELVNLHRGQGMDLFWRDTLTCPTEDDYLEMVGNKTGGLFRLGIKLMQAESASSVDCVPLVNLIGLIFQIRDDYMNLSSREYSDNKGLCEDLTEGKFSFPVIHSIRANPANMQLINILKQKTTDVQVKRYAVSYMESTGSFEYTRNVIGILIARARKMASQMDRGHGETHGVQKILDKMVVEK
ncbi:geranylgeranyl diphosphate synthase [Metarhizium album ARSEF 1941]|uniref:Geranylgeranyl diphosphate synthase n=1 Tax=Metarhizium album (strain ARSEF 1941) TaxID=1081103 RepID=A0A0B2WRK7_METAS|nr:geranylgeranyl diphosphate synthase [Metarhizium album ARSEF 1941]KHN96658.1 geranylgeranyl diphosphate synthase [Metarhizium album ARSEF 1941]